ncbi:MAG: FecR domain-containing protein, partial [Deltaproteobacteria bacterium]|nr:FecR domain-containing protein [Deltaproteobacteria bacterium]
MEAAEAAVGFEQQPMKSRLWLPALVASLLLCMEIYALFFDIGSQSKLKTSTLPLIATFQQGINEVRDRQGGTITWHVPLTGQELREQDAILTMARAQALVRFTDGAELNIEPDSLVVLEKSPTEESQRLHKIVVRLVQGSLTKQTAGTQPMSVDLAGSHVEDATGLALFHLRRNGGQIDIEVDQGTVKVGEAAEAKIVDSTQKATIREGKVEVQTLPVRFTDLKPAGGARIGRDRRDERITLEWNQITDGYAPDFEPVVVVSRQPDLSDATEAEIKDNKDGHLRAQFEASEDGPRFWQVRAKNGSVKSKIGTLFTVTRTTPEVTTPDDEHEAVVDQPISFGWQPLGAIVTLETSATEDFADSKRLAPQPGEHEVKASFPAAQKLYWRLRADYGPGVGMAPPTETRELTIKARPTLKAPGKFKSKIRTQTSQLERFLEELAGIFWFNSAMADEIVPRSQKIAVELEWENIEGAEQYRLQIAMDSDFKDIVLDRKLQKPEFVYKTRQTAREQKLYYRVASIDPQGNQGEFSDAQELEIEALPEPAKKTVAKAPPKPPKSPEPLKPPEVKPVLLTEDQRRDRERFHLSLQLGAAYHSRSFTSLTRPTTSVGAGMIPAYGGLELAHRLGSAALEADDGHGVSLAVGAALLAEQAEPTTAGIVVEKFPIPLLRAWVLLEKEVWGAFGGVGLYGSTSQKFSWNGRHAVNERVMVLGVAGMLTSSQVLPRAWHWRTQLGLVGSGA